jgi:hypothetical protein
MNLIDKIIALKNRFVAGKGIDEDIVTIDGWMEEAKRLMLLKSLKDHDGVKYVLEIFEGEIRKINEALLKSDSKTLSDSERDRLLDKRDLAQKYVGLFVGVEDELERLEDVVDKEG